MTKLSNYVVGKNGSIKDAIAKISQNYSRCVIVTDDNNTVIGVISEGDIVRNLLDDVSLYTPVAKIVQPSFRYMHERDMVEALNLLRNVGVTLVPLVDKSFKLLDVITIHEVMDYYVDKYGLTH